jgi:hypothetical protein
MHLQTQNYGYNGSDNLFTQSVIQYPCKSTQILNEECNNTYNKYQLKHNNEDSLLILNEVVIYSITLFEISRST